MIGAAVSVRLTLSVNTAHRFDRQSATEPVTHGFVLTGVH